MNLTDIINNAQGAGMIPRPVVFNVPSPGFLNAVTRQRKTAVGNA